MKLDSFQKLYVHELKDLYSAEMQLLKVLPKMSEASSDENLKRAFELHYKETQNQVKRLESIFSKLEFSPSGHRCVAMAGLIEEAEEIIKEVEEEAVRDAGLVAAAHRIEHYEIAGYGTARAYAEKLGDYEAADLLDETLLEESHADHKLSRLALRSLNFQALVQNRD